MKLLYEGWRVREVTDVVKKHAKNEEHLFVGMPNNVVNTENVAGSEGKGCRGQWGSGDWESNFALSVMVEWLATAYPQFTYAVSQASYIANPPVEALYVLDGLKPIGLVTQHERDNTISLRFTNKRIEDAMYRNSYQQTCKRSVAKKIFKKYFYPPTPIELGITAEHSVRDVMHTMERELRDTLRKATHIVQTTVVDNINSPAVTQCLTDMGHGGLVSSFLDARENLDLAEGMAKMVMHHQGGAIVQLMEDKYLIRTIRDTGSSSGKLSMNRRGTMTTTHNIGNEMLDRSELPPKAREGIALLKMTEPHTYISGVGFKATDTEFFLVDISNDAEVTDADE
tara:strand:- start:1360 stop:2379 length:1020 start_codon:yes stop_codon:yes gene_type:complete